ncbi:MAG TPA: hypothetical protein VJQ47_11840 [Steroidobacteraceae bacterium]|nr:hypothetical protein [Steroidobacteraceae bacterium]
MSTPYPAQDRSATSSLFRSLPASDRALWLAAGVLCAIYILYLGLLTSFPLQDYPNHVARAAVMADLIFHHGARFGHAFGFHFAFVPYLLGDLVMAGGVELLGPSAGAAFFSTLVLLSLPCALLLYLRVHNIAPRGQLLIFLLSLYLSTDYFYWLGFMAYRLAMAAVVVNLALAQGLRQKGSWTAGVVYCGAIALGYFIHLTALVFFAAALGITAVLRVWQGSSTWRREAMLLLPALVLSALHFGVVTAEYGSSDPPSYQYYWGEPRDKLTHVTDEFWRFGGLSATLMMLALFACLLWPIRRELWQGGLKKPAVVEQLVLALFFVGVYLVLPNRYADSSYVDIRALPLTTLFLLFACLHLAADSTRARDFGRPAMLAIAATLGVVNLAYLARHAQPNDRWIMRYRQVVAAIPRGATVLPVYTQPKQATLYPFMHVASFAVLDRDAVIPYLFAADRGDPMKYFRYINRPYTPDEMWYRARAKWRASPERHFAIEGQTYTWRISYSQKGRRWQLLPYIPVDWNQITCTYDYLLVMQPYDRRVIEVSARIVAANDSAALLEVDRAQCRPDAPRDPVTQTLGP